jgi:membrane protease YdiL (CAAX protease family)
MKSIARTQTSNIWIAWLSMAMFVMIVAGIMLATWMESAPRVIALGLVSIAMVVSSFLHRCGGYFSAFTDAVDSEKRATIHSWCKTVTLTLALCAVLFIACWILGAVYVSGLQTFFDKSPYHWLLVKLPTIVAQQWIFCWALLPNAYYVLRSKLMACTVGAIAFALCHFPNPLLMFLTLIASFAWGQLYVRYRRILPLILSHFVLSICAASFCGEYIFNLRVGMPCFQVLPFRAVHNGSATWIMPGCVVGEIDSVVQHGSTLEIGGWCFDPIHNYTPSRFNVFQANGIRQINLPPSQIIERSDKIEFTGQQNVRCGFQFSLENTGFAQNGLYVFPENRNGWCDLVTHKTYLDFLPDGATDYPFAVLNPNADGYFRIIGADHNRLLINGWAIDLESTEVCSSIYMFNGEKVSKVVLTKHSISRPDIVSAYREDEFLDCGFQCEITADQPGRLRMFARKSNGQLFELKQHFDRKE